MTSPTVQLFNRATTIAIDLDRTTYPGPPHTTGPDAIAAIIRTTATSHTRSAGGEPVTGGGIGDPTSAAALRAIARPQRDELRDILRLDIEVAFAVAATARITRNCTSDPAPHNWPTMIATVRQLRSRKLLEAAIDVGVDLLRDVGRYHDAITTIARIHDGHCAHTPDDTAKLATGDPVCMSHARIGDYDRPRYRQHRVCRVCHDLLAQIGNPSELDNDPDAWPPVELLREYADMERTGKRVDYRRMRSDWIERHQPGSRSA